MNGKIFVVWVVIMLLVLGVQAIAIHAAYERRVAKCRDAYPTLTVAQCEFLAETGRYSR